MATRMIVNVFRGHRLGTEDFVSLLLIGAMFIAFTIAGLSVYRTNKQASETHTALCIFKYDIVTRRDESVKLLKDNPGELIFGIPRQVYITSVENQTATIASLRVLDCPQDNPTNIGG